MSEFLKNLSQLWENILTNISNTNLSTWAILLGMFAVWAVFAFFSLRDQIRNPEQYKDTDKFIPPY